jgi:hypothetical protein
MEMGEELITMGLAISEEITQDHRPHRESLSHSSTWIISKW